MSFTFQVVLLQFFSFGNSSDEHILCNFNKVKRNNYAKSIGLTCVLQKTKYDERENSCRWF